MRLHYYCDNCGSEIVLQDSLRLGDRYDTCPICGDEDGAFVELVLKEGEGEGVQEHAH